MKRMFAVPVFSVVGIFIGSMLTSAAVVRESAHGRTYSDVRAIPHRPVGLVLGCSMRLSNGAFNPFFVNRVSAAADLYRAGKVDRLLVSGETHANGYNEAADLKAALIGSGIPAQRIDADFAGFRTLDSVVHARKVFGLNQVTIVSQRSHNRRAIFLAVHSGLDAIGYDASMAGVQDGFWYAFREHFAGLKAVLDIFVLHTQPRAQS